MGIIRNRANGKNNANFHRRSHIGDRPRILHDLPNSLNTESTHRLLRHVLT
jgi:hypothetical protein